MNPDAQYRRFVLLFFVSAAGFTGLWAACVLLLNALYDNSPAGLARNRSFNSAIIGNSRIVNADPAILTARTGFSFAALAAPSLWPTEQMVILKQFLRHHPDARAVVLGMDDVWCTDPLLRSRDFNADDFDDAKRRFLHDLRPGSKAREELNSRLRVLIGVKALRRDGFRSYDYQFVDAGADKMDVVRPKFSSARPTNPYTSLDSFPAADLMRDALSIAPAQTIFVLVWPPWHISVVAVPGSDAEKALAKCHEVYADLIKGRHPMAIVNWAAEHPVNFVDENFFDPVHYRVNVGKELSEEIAASIRNVSQ